MVDSASPDGASAGVATNGDVVVAVASSSSPQQNSPAPAVQAAAAGAAPAGKAATPSAGAPASAAVADAASTDKPAAEDGKKKKPVAPPAVPFRALYRYATALDILLVVGSFILAAAMGCIMPLFSLFFGNLLNALNNPLDFEKNVNWICIQLGILAGSAGVVSYLQAAFAAVVASRQAARIREEYIRAMLRQDLEFADKNRMDEAASRLSSDVAEIEDGIGPKLPQSMMSLSSTIAGIVVAFVNNWKLSLLTMGFIPAMAIVGGAIHTAMGKMGKNGNDSYGRAGSVVTEVLTSIRTVLAYGGEKAEVSRYEKYLAEAEKSSVKKGLLTGASMGFFFFVMFITYGVVLLFGAKLVIWARDDHPDCAINPTLDYCFSGGTVMTVLFSLMIGAGSIGQAAPGMQALTTARSSAYRIFEIIDRTPDVDSSSSDGIIFPAGAPFVPRIVFDNVTFRYPSRPDMPALQNFSLTIEPGEMVALVGQSGSGKSTIVALLQRWYDNLETGTITLNGVDIRKYNVQWLRSQQALVQQEPVLFAASIADNIALGKVAKLPGLKAAVTDDNLVPGVTREEVMAAAQVAHAHDFILAQPQGYDTHINTSRLSGGQKQRVAIARAVIRNAPILLLDEATSALDTHNERVVQAAIDALVEKHSQTTLVIAHRLSTIQNADRVVVLNKGRIVEQGTHEQLYAMPEGVYRKMRDLQRIGAPAKSAAGAATGGAGAATTATASVTEDPAAAARPKPLTVETRQPSPSPPVTDVPSSSGKPAATVEKDKPAAEVIEYDGAGKRDWTLIDDPAKLPAVSAARLYGYNRPELWWGLLGILCSLMMSAMFPVFSLILSRFTSIFFNTNSDEVWKGAQELLGWYVLIASLALISESCASYAFALLGERLVRRVRKDAFQSILSFEVAWHDKERNSAGAVASRLATDAALLKFASGVSLNFNVRNAGSLVTGLVIAFTASWRLTLVILAVAPLIGVAGWLQMKFMRESAEGSKTAYADAAGVATEALGSFKTVTAYGLQTHTLTRFHAKCEVPVRKNLRAAWAAGIGFGVSNLFMIGCYALCFWVGSQFILRGWMTFQELLQSFFSVIFSAMGLGHASALTSDAAKADIAARSLFAIIDRKTKIDANASVGNNTVASVSASPAAGGAAIVPTVVSPGRALHTAPVKGRIELRDVKFSYPTRREAQVLKGLSLTIEPGQTVGICGPSGCGKSTLVQLLERFYDCDSGSISIDGVDIKDWNLSALRSQIGWVQQEAPLFADSLAYNIGYGAASSDKPVAPGVGVPPDAGENAPMPAGFTVTPEITAAAATANALDFITAEKHGFATYAGDKGSQLSGGQKQRVAIARAVVRNAPIFFGDEATAALDSESERVVQQALDALLQNKGDNRSAIIIAHRLATIRNADKIIVVNDGTVAEEGTFDELVARDGLFARMVAEQSAGEGTR